MDVLEIRKVGLVEKYMQLLLSLWQMSLTGFAYKLGSALALIVSLTYYSNSAASKWYQVSAVRRIKQEWLRVTTSLKYRHGWEDQRDYTTATVL